MFCNKDSVAVVVGLYLILTLFVEAVTLGRLLVKFFLFHESRRRVCNYFGPYPIHILFVIGYVMRTTLVTFPRKPRSSSGWSRLLFHWLSTGYEQDRIEYGECLPLKELLSQIGSIQFKYCFLKMNAQLLGKCSYQGYSVTDSGTF